MNCTPRSLKPGAYPREPAPWNWISPRSSRLALKCGRAANFSTHPVAKEDIALVVPVDVSAADVQQVIVEGAGELLETAALFDVYTGDQVPEGHKSLAFALRFRAPDRTLAAEEIAQARQSAIDAAADRFGARLR